MTESTGLASSEFVEMTYAAALRWAMDQALERDSRVFLLGEDVGGFGGAFGVTAGLIDKYGPERVRDTPISEAGIVSAGVGAAIMGMRPIVELQFSDFITNAMDPIVNQAAKVHFMFGGAMSVPLLIRAPFGGGAGLAAQHSQSLEAWFYHVPGLKVVAPATADDARGLLLAALEDPNPTLLFEHKLLYARKGPVRTTLEPEPLGVARVWREGKDATVVAYSMMAHRALEAADTLANEGLDLEVIDLRSLVPLDIETVVRSVEKTGRLVVCYEAAKRGGIGADIVAQIAESPSFDFLDAPVLRVAGLETPIPYSPELERVVIPSTERMVEEVRRWWHSEVVGHGGN